MAEKIQISNHLPVPSKKTAIDNLDLNLLRNLTAEGVFMHRSGSRDKGAAWQKVADNLSTAHSKLNFTSRAVRDRFNILSKKLKAKLSKEQRATGGGEIETSESEGLLEEMLELSDETDRVAEEMNEKKKEEKEKKVGIEMRKRAMERMGETRKRSVEKEADERKKRRKSSDTMDWLKEKVEMKEKERKEQQNQQMLQTQMLQQMTQQQQQQLIIVQQQMCNMLQMFMNNKEK